MLYTSLEFAIFLVILLVAFVLVTPKRRLSILLIASYAFYAFANIWHLPILIAVTALTYASARTLARQRSMLILGITISIILCALGFFKYRILLTDPLDASGFREPSAIALWSLPIGISFYSFQAISYLVDVYRGRVIAAKRVAVVGLYLAFFPQILAGPIERAHSLIPQFTRFLTVNVNNMLCGCKIILFGLCCKLAVADQLSVIVNDVYRYPLQYSSGANVAALYIYSFEIYFDFYAYTSISIGLARLFGIDLHRNFNHPYLATNLGDFWQRWHMTLSSWLRDYLYRPLGGRNINIIFHIRNIVIVFIFSGLWHGAAITFILWGAIHAALYLAGYYTRSVRQKFGDWIGWNRLLFAPTVLNILITFSIVTFAWVCFRASSLEQIVVVVTHMISWDASGTSALDLIGRPERVAPIVLMFFLLVMDSLGWIRPLIEKMPKTFDETVKEIGLINLLLIAVLLLGASGSREFIYYRF